MLPTSTEVEYFIEVYRTRHISRSAIRLGVTQPTLTVSLKRLEEKLGATLFHRTRQGVIPTHQGSLFYSKAHQLLNCWSEVHKNLHHSVSEIQGRFRVGCHPSVGAYVLPKLLERLEKQAPGIELELIHDFSRKITEGVVSYAIDLGFVVNPARHPDLVLKKLGDDRVLFWKRRGRESVPKRIFADIGLIQVQEILSKTHSKILRDWTLTSTSSLELIRSLVLSGQGIGILPERVAKAEGADLVPYAPALPTYEDEICLAYRRNALSSSAGKELIRLASFNL